MYDGDLGIALSDTYTSGIFLSNLSRKQAKLFAGVRCDSGDELDFTDKLVARYRELGIDPTTCLLYTSLHAQGRAPPAPSSDSRRRYPSR